ncbi:hypothetical protein GCM10017586_20830 [Microbacterium imperiale]|uniref:Uncharacterized protein n=1 Tax=Microbacterium imperiale TaxID=33884 RepID=A0A9W6M3S2_9MICO|nr:hypothetical protein GCM10017544_24050 [Microbacterium imperiale]GLJ80400.1 hypothetical protein GCM10017586_20830 [Microbacterium imperiale]
MRTVDRLEIARPRTIAVSAPRVRKNPAAKGRARPPHTGRSRVANSVSVDADDPAAPVLLMRGFVMVTL